MSKRIVIIGGGVIGLATAWECQKRGHHVTVIDRKTPQRDGCSFGNAGMIVPSHFIPLAAPGMIAMGLKWMANPESPFYIRPRMSLDLVSWLWKFQRSCTRAHVDAASPLLRDMHLASRAAYEALQSELPEGFGWSPGGLLMLCRTKHALDEESHTAGLANRLGVAAEVLDADATAKLDPGIVMSVRGSVYYPRDCHLSPNRLMRALEDRLVQSGAAFHWGTDWTGIVSRGDRVEQVTTSGGDLRCDELIVCGGVWSSSIGKRLDVALPMQAGKGYSVTLQSPRQTPTICSILTEARVAVTPMGDRLRFGGTMEIAGLDESITASRVRGILKSIPGYFPDFRVEDFQDCEPWVGLRPCSPDGLPFLGRTKRWNNVIVSTGHAMMGISLAMVSAHLVGQWVEREPASIERTELMSPDRFA